MCAAKPTLMIHKRDGSVVKRFGSLRAAAQAYNHTPEAVLALVRKGALMEGACMLRYEEDWGGCEDFGRRTHNRPLIVAIGQDVRWFPSVNIAAPALGVTKNYLHGLIAGRRKSSDGIRVRYATSTDDWPLLCEDVSKLAKAGVKPPDPLVLGRPAHDRMR